MNLSLVIEWKENIRRFFEENKTVIFFTFLFGIAVNYAGFSFQSAYNMDSVFYEQNFRYQAGIWEIINGRWGIPFIDRIKHGLIPVAFLTIICIAILSITAALIIDIFKPAMAMRYCISLLMVVSPALMSIITYSYCIDSYTFSVALAVLYAWLLFYQKNYLLAGIACVASLSLYQANCSCCIVLICGMWTNELLQGQYKTSEMIKRYLLYCITFGISLLTYYFIATVIIKLLHQSWASYGGASGFSVIKLIQTLPHSILNAFDTVQKFFYTDSFVHNKPWHIAGLLSSLLVILVISIFRSALKQRLSLSQLIGIIIGLAAMFMSGALILIITYQAGFALRMAYSMTVLLIALLCLLSNMIELAFGRRSIFRAIAFVLILGLLRGYTGMASATYISYQHQDRVAYALADDIMQDVKLKYGSINAQRVAIIGMVKENPTYHSKISAEDQGIIDPFVIDHSPNTTYWTTLRTWNSYFSRFFGINDIFTITQDEYDSIVNSDQFNNMAVYPDDGSIEQFSNNIVAIKIS